ncbi:Hypothetical predicted protein [Marmota monax]|uniref:Uncharacterized protein n=1 Tax=Marmota monax TaxID=9995 RepID=A0A5E4B4H9_MARMO|nr:Hypothetical predicted protein [Marmota monax]
MVARGFRIICLPHAPVPPKAATPDPAHKHGSLRSRIRLRCTGTLKLTRSSLGKSYEVLHSVFHAPVERYWDSEGCQNHHRAANYV